MKIRLRWLLMVVGAFGLIAGMTGCTQSEENAVKDAFDPGPPIRKAFSVSLEVVAQQIIQYDSVNGQVPQGDGLLVLQQAGMRSTPDTDPWGNKIRYHGEGSHFTLSSAGPDCKWGTKDDIVIKR